MNTETEPDEDQYSQKAMLLEQSLRYAEDIARIYVEERARRRALERANERLIREMAARRRAEKELRLAREELERRVQQRTKELSAANERLRREVAQRKGAEEQLRTALKEKEVLLSEVHHRVKNNLQIIYSLLDLQCSRVRDATVLGALRDSQSRIRSMALIHEQLYRSRNVSTIDFSEYLSISLMRCCTPTLKRSG